MNGIWLSIICIVLLFIVSIQLALAKQTFLQILCYIWIILMAYDDYSWYRKKRMADTTATK